MRHGLGLVLLLAILLSSHALYTASKHGAGTPTLIKVALYADTGASVRGVADTLAVLNYPHSGIHAVKVNATDIQRNLSMRYYDAVYFAGGGGTKMSKTLGERGREAVVRFVATGGAYVGVCAGAFLAMEHLNISVFDDVSYPYNGDHKRGDGNTTVVLTQDGEHGLAGVKAARLRHQFIFYANGPVMANSANISKMTPETADPVVLATFGTTSVPAEANYTGPNAGGGEAAIVSNLFGRGRVLVSGPHPEASPMDFPHEHAPPSKPGTEPAFLVQSFVQYAVHMSRSITGQPKSL